MTFSVYALRLKGDCEIRYVGLTNGDPANRICNLRSCEVGAGIASSFGQWLDSHHADIEAITLAAFNDRREGKAAEIASISLAVTMGQRLFNRDHVPKHLRISSERVPYISADMRTFRERFAA